MSDSHSFLTCAQWLYTSTLSDAAFRKCIRTGDKYALDAYIISIYDTAHTNYTL